MVSVKINKPSFIVSDVILQQKGDFTENDILNQVKDRLIDQFESLENLSNYVIFKLNDMCEYGLIGRTELYYFQV